MRETAYRYFQPVPGKYFHPAEDPLEDAEFREVYRGTVPVGSSSQDALEQLFILHNRDDRPERRRIPSMSVGHVIALDGHGAFLVGPVGFLAVERDPAREGGFRTATATAARHDANPL